MKQKVITGSVVLLVCGAMLAGAGGQQGATAGPMEISWMGLYAHTVEDGNPVQQHLEEKFNVKFINTIADFQETEANTLRVASDEHPDAMYTWGPERLEWYLKGAFRSISRSMIDEHMPNYVRSMNALGAGSWFYGLVPGTTDEYYAIPRRVDYQDGCGYLPGFRLDWIEKVAPDLTPTNLNPSALEDLAPTAAPGTHMRWLDSFTWDQLETIMRGYVNEDPDGNGQQDTSAYGGTNRLIYWGGLGLVFYSYGVNEVANYQETDGSTVLDATYSRSKLALERLQDWWQQGLIDSELPTIGARADFVNKLVQGKTGSFMRTVACGRNVETGQNPDWCNQIVQSGPDPDAKTLVTLMPEPPPGGESRCRMENAAMPLEAAPGGGGFVVRHDVSDEKLALILQIYDYTNFDPEGMVIGYYGIPGLHFDWTGTPFQSQLIVKPEVVEGGSDYRSSQGILYYNAYSPHDDLTAFTRDEFGQRDNEWFVKFGGRYNNSERAYREDLFGVSDYAELWARDGGALRTIRDDFFWKAITTDLDIDAEWPAYVQTWMNAGGRAVLEEISKAPTVDDIRAGRVTPP